MIKYFSLLRLTAEVKSVLSFQFPAIIGVLNAILNFVKSPLYFKRKELQMTILDDRKTNRLKIHSICDNMSSIR